MSIDVTVQADLARHYAYCIANEADYGPCQKDGQYS
jgi:hypothetical protein